MKTQSSPQPESGPALLETLNKTNGLLEQFVQSLSQWNAENDSHRKRLDKYATELTQSMQSILNVAGNLVPTDGANQKTLISESSTLPKTFSKTLNAIKHESIGPNIDMSLQSKQTESAKSQMVKLEPDATGFLVKSEIGSGTAIKPGPACSKPGALKSRGATVLKSPVVFIPATPIKREQSDVAVVPAKRMKRSYSAMDRAMVHVEADGNVAKGKLVTFTSEMTPKRALRRSGEISAEKTRKILSTKTSKNQNTVSSPANLSARTMKIVDAARKANDSKKKSA